MPSSYVIGTHFEDLIKRQIASGRYSSASEVIRDALRLFEEQEELRAVRIEQLRRQINEGKNSGPGTLAADVFNRLETKYSRLEKES
ncbi:type II toxin-antitoxin system ParD family antitoxin [Desulfosarcina ovata]|uniref:Addiction module antitoxin n=1 Tax=Desulfosarcina ovata subsp. ovata TaxID=2752305 RepID=A0A5K8A3T8_9BACT|nr:type II toxin-antitoxin system ParD family antitoxin [Desulfosarcina ovata]BBO87131.1 addiction module antitoxin [Desulfosarcina ovata subsp. ovata]